MIFCLTLKRTKSYFCFNVIDTYLFYDYIFNAEEHSILVFKNLLIGLNVFVKNKPYIIVCLCDCYFVNIV